MKYFNIYTEGVNLKVQQERFIGELHYDFGKVNKDYYIRLPLKNEKLETLSEKTVDYKDYHKNPSKWFEGKFYNNMIAVRRTLDVAEEDVEKIDRYITINEFRLANHQIYRNSAYLARRCSFFIDLDFHNIPIDEINDKIMELLMRIGLKIYDGSILCPTMITDSGRGLGLFYILENPVVYTDVTGMKRFKEIYTKLLQRFRDLVGDIVEVDSTITDAQRVCRIPGTYNTKAEKYAEIIGVYNINEDAEHGIRYSLDDIDRGCHLEEVKIKEKTYKKLKRTEKDNPALNLDKIIQKQNEEKIKVDIEDREYNDTVFKRSTIRAKITMGYRYQMLIDLLQYKDTWIGYRHSYIFVMYNTLKVFLPNHIAIRDIFRINKLFDTPLEETEVWTVIDSVDKHIELQGEESKHIDIDYYFWFTNIMIAAILDAYDDMDGMGVDFGETQAIRDENNDRRYTVKVLICKFYLQGLTKKAVIDSLSDQGYECSLSTVKRVLKEAGINTKNRKDLRFEDIVENIKKPYLHEKGQKKGQLSLNKGEREEREVLEQIASSNQSISPYTRIEATQDKVYQFLQSGADAFVEGIAGSGKTAVIKKWVMDMTPEERERTLIVAPTGKASALYDSGRTIHKAFDFHIEIYTPDEELIIKKYLYRFERVVIDEISMVRFDIFNQIMRVINAIEQETGKHIQIILVGDLQQLAPVFPKPMKEMFNYYWKEELGFDVFAPWFFLSKLYHERKFIHLYINKNMRNQNEEDNQNYELIRNGDASNISYFNRLYNPEADDIKDAIHICVTNAKVDEINDARIEEYSQGKEYYYSNVYLWDDGAKDVYIPDGKFEKDTPFKFKLKYFVGMRVMITLNSRFYKNGMLGTIHRIDYMNDIILIRLDDGKVVRIDKISLEIEIDGKKERVLQFPIVPAYAITIHKSQGATFDKVVVHLEGRVQVGQLYTALTRVRDSSDMILADKITRDMVRPNKFLIDAAYAMLYRTQEIDEV